MKELLILGAVYLVFALPLSIMDSKKFRISLPLLMLGVISLLGAKFFLIVPRISLIKNLLLAIATAFLIYFSTRVLSGDGLGWGDVFFGIYTSIFTGFYRNIIATVFAALLGVLYYLFLAMIQKFKKKQILRPIFAIPFVPFITAGALLSFVLFLL